MFEKGLLPLLQTHSFEGNVKKDACCPNDAAHWMWLVDFLSMGHVFLNQIHRQMGHVQKYLINESTVNRRHFSYYDSFINCLLNRQIITVHI